MAIDGGKDDVEVAVAVEVVGGDAGAVADVGADLAQPRAGGERELCSTKAPVQAAGGRKADDITVAGTSGLVMRSVWRTMDGGVQATVRNASKPNSDSRR